MFYLCFFCYYFLIWKLPFVIKWKACIWPSLEQGMKNLHVRSHFSPLCYFHFSWLNFKSKIFPACFQVAPHDYISLVKAALGILVLVLFRIFQVAAFLFLDFEGNIKISPVPLLWYQSGLSMLSLPKTSYSRFQLVIFSCRWLEDAGYTHYLKSCGAPHFDSSMLDCFYGY